MSKNTTISDETVTVKKHMVGDILRKAEYEWDKLPKTTKSALIDFARLFNLVDYRTLRDYKWDVLADINDKFRNLKEINIRGKKS
jgi:hypothetical protein